MESIITDGILTGLATILVALIGYVSQKVVSYLQEKGVAEKLESKRYLVDIAVKAVEQIYKNEDGQFKFDVAKTEALNLLNKNGLKISDKELDNFIEASVNAMNGSFIGILGQREEDK